MGSLGGKNCLEVKVCSVGLSPAKVVLDSNSLSCCISLKGLLDILLPYK